MMLKQLRVNYILVENTSSIIIILQLYAELLLACDNRVVAQ